MGVKEIKNELDRMIGELCDLSWMIGDQEKSESEQKSKKTEKKNEIKTCRFKHLYATRKHGCSGFKEDDECFICEYRR